MKTRLLSLLTASASLALLSALTPVGALAAETLIATPLSAAGVSELRLLLELPGVTRHEAVFSPAEQEGLRALGDPLSARAEKVTLRDARALTEVKAWQARVAPHLALDNAPLPISLEAAPKASKPKPAAKAKAASKKPAAAPTVAPTGSPEPSPAAPPPVASEPLPVAPAPRAPAPAAPADPFESEQWGLHNDGREQVAPLNDITNTRAAGRAGEDIRVAPLGADPRTGEPIVVAILDTGIDATHPDLGEAVVRKPRECEALDAYRACLAGGDRAACDKRYASLDSDGNGYPLDCSGWNVTVGKSPVTGIQGNSNTVDEIGHGTHVAGVIGALRNGVGVTGVSQNVAFLPVKVITRAPKTPVQPQSTAPSTPLAEELPSPSEKNQKWETGFADIIARGVLYAVRSGARIINMSLAWPASADSALMRRMINLAQSHGVLVVAAAGNDSTEAQVMPCNYPGVLCVASHNPDGKLSRFSNFGANVDIAAPGFHILSTWPLGQRAETFTDVPGYDFKNGTSMAAPFVAGALARMLHDGYASQEAVARILAGSRALQPDALGKQVQFGSLDLWGAYTVAPRPWIVPESKDPVRASWDRAAPTVRLELPLRNLWQDGQDVLVSARLPDEWAGRARLSAALWNIPSWKSGESRRIPVELEILDPRLPGEIPVHLHVSSALDTPAQPVRALTVKVQLAVAVDARFGGADALPLRLLPGAESIAPEAMIRTIVTSGVSSDSPRPRPDYAAVTKARGVTFVQVLEALSAEEAGSGAAYAVHPRKSFAPDHGELLALYRLDWNAADGRADDGYVFLFMLPADPQRKGSGLRFVYLDSALNVARHVDYATGIAKFPENFQWLKLGAGFTPGWLVGGTTPELEKPRWNPWDPNPVDWAQLRYYYLAADGLRSVSAPAGMIFAGVLAQSPAQKREGVVPVLLAKGDTYQLSYQLGAIREGAAGLATLTELKPLTLPRYRMLLNADAVLATLGLDGDSGGTALATSPSPGLQRIEFFGADGQWRSEGVTQPLTAGDSVLRLAGAFQGKYGSSAFVQTQYDLQFHDFATGRAASTSLKRFTFIPQLAFLKAFHPIIVQNENSGELQAAMLMAGDLAGGDTLEVALAGPVAGDAGGTGALEIPAKLRLTAAAGCQRILNPVNPISSAPGSSGASEVVFFCGDRLVFVPLTY